MRVTRPGRCGPAARSATRFANQLLFGMWPLFYFSAASARMYPVAALSGRFDCPRLKEGTVLRDAYERAAQKRAIEHMMSSMVRRSEAMPHFMRDFKGRRRCEGQ